MIIKNAKALQPKGFLFRLSINYKNNKNIFGKIEIMYYLYIIKQTHKAMKTVDEIRIEAIRVINKVITLKANVANGCYSDKAELAKQMPRLEDIKNWAIQNNQLPEIRNYFASHNFGQTCQFAAKEISKLFY